MDTARMVDWTLASYQVLVWTEMENAAPMFWTWDSHVTCVDPPSNWPACPLGVHGVYALCNSANHQSDWASDSSDHCCMVPRWLGIIWHRSSCKGGTCTSNGSSSACQPCLKLPTAAITAAGGSIITVCQGPSSCCAQPCTLDETY